MTSWFEEEAQRRADRDQPSVQPLEAVKEPVSEPESEEKATTPGNETKTSNIALGAAVIVLVGVIAWSGFTLFGSTDQDQSAARVQGVGASQESPVESAQSESAPSVQQAGSACDAQTLDADRATLAGTIVAFESAYYDKNVEELRRTLAKDAPAQSTEWETVLPEVVTDSMTWCVVVSDTDADDDDKADVALTVKDADSETTYRQTVTGKKAGDSWFIELIENREQS